LIPEREPEKRLPLPRWAAGAQIAQCRNILVRQRRTAAILPTFIVGGTWNGCNPNTVMSINWRASLVPAAAVIPAPRAYTIIAAVKTPVVCHWAVGLLGGQPSQCGGWDSFGGPGLLCWLVLELNPQRYVPAPDLMTVRPSSCRKSPSLGAKAVMPQTQVWAGCHPGPVPRESSGKPPTGAHRF